MAEEIRLTTLEKMLKKYFNEISKDKMCPHVTTSTRGLPVCGKYLENGKNSENDRKIDYERFINACSNKAECSRRCSRYVGNPFD